MAKVIPIVATEEILNPKTGIIEYKSDEEYNGNALLILPDDDNKRVFITNPLHTVGKVSVKMRPLVIPATKFKIGDVVANLITLD